jgi:hypothetical protein
MSTGILKRKILPDGEARLASSPLRSYSGLAVRYPDVSNARQPRSNVSNGAGWRISVAFEVICKRIDVWSTDSSAQAPERFGRGEVLFEHGLSLLNIGQ